LPGCHTHGKTVAEAMANLKNAMTLYIEVEIEKKIAEKGDILKDTGVKAEK